MTKEDVVITCGDFGIVWDFRGESAPEKYNLDWLEKRNFTTVFVDGNHENHIRLSQFPVKEWNGGLVHELRPSVFHLIRGNVYNINGKSIFAFGGARSHDIRDGILDPDKDKELIKEWRYDPTKMFRVLNRSWWEAEMPDIHDMMRGSFNLMEHNNKVDYIVTHDCAASTLALISHGKYKCNDLNIYLEEIRVNVEFNKWFFGHHHDDAAINDKEIMLYTQIIRIA